MEEYFEEQQLEGKSQDVMSSKIKCLPLPGELQLNFFFSDNTHPMFALKSDSVDLFATDVVSFYTLCVMVETFERRLQSLAVSPG